MMEHKKLLAHAVAHKASDIHINVGIPPIIRIDTKLVITDFPVVTNDDAKEMLITMVGADRFSKFEMKRDLDFSTTLDDGHRFRVNAHYQRDTIAISFRIISSEVPDIEDLHMPDILNDLIDLPRGLVLVTGHTGAGKSTTLASMLAAINKKYSRHVITIEDPIEYLLKNDKCIIEQREVGSDCPDFSSGLRHILRQDPDIIMVGEMRDLETTSFTITAAETGHLVFSTLHTVNASQTIDRIIDIYPSTQQNQIRAMLANTLQAVVSQTLFRRIDTNGMVPGTEVLLCTPAVRNCIRENRIYEIPNIIETNRNLGMHLMDYSIADIYNKGYIDRDEAINRSTNPRKMDTLLSPRK